MVFEVIRLLLMRAPNLVSEPPWIMPCLAALAWTAADTAQR